MDRNDLCWCGSGKKWKKCHRDRHLGNPKPFGKISLEIMEEFEKGYCLHPDAAKGVCGGGIIDAHTVQKRGGLKAISENGHVYSPRNGASFIANTGGRIEPRKVGVNSASTFQGFCGKHDNIMFKPAETCSSMSVEIFFLLSYRAACYELFQKVAAQRLLPHQREIDRGQPFEVQCEIQNELNAYYHGLKLGVRDALNTKYNFDKIFKSKDYSKFRFYAIIFDGVLPICASGGFSPEVDFSGNTIQNLGYSPKFAEHIMFNVTVYEGKTVAVLGWISENSKVNEEFVSSLRSLPAEEKADAIARLSFEHLENIFIRPSWWQGLPDDIRISVLKRISSGMLLGAKRSSSSLLSTENFLPAMNIDEEVNG